PLDRGRRLRGGAAEAGEVRGGHRPRPAKRLPERLPGRRVQREGMEEHQRPGACHGRQGSQASPAPTAGALADVPLGLRNGAAATCAMSQGAILARAKSRSQSSFGGVVPSRAWARSGETLVAALAVEHHAEGAVVPFLVVSEAPGLLDWDPALPGALSV